MHHKSKKIQIKKPHFSIHHQPATSMTPFTSRLNPKTSLAAFACASAVHSNQTILLDAQQGAQDGFLPGNVYQAEVRPPFVGKQVFRMHVLDYKHIELTANGPLLDLDNGRAAYSIDTDNGVISFNANQETAQKFKDRGMRFEEFVRYDADKDEPILKATTPIGVKKNVYFRRVLN